MIHAKSIIIEQLNYKDKIIIYQSDSIGALKDFNGKIKGAKLIKKKHVKAHTKNKTNRTVVNRLVDKMAKKQMLKYRALLND